MELKSNVDLKLSQFYNEGTLNIFCDASIIGKHGDFTGCYGAVAVIMDSIIDAEYRLASNTTNNNCEIKGIRLALHLANKWKNQFRFINIFSDSQISVFGIRDYIYKWKYNPKDGLLYGTAGTPVINQSVFIECHDILMNLALAPNCTIEILHQSGHVSNGYNELREAAMIFSRSNNIPGNIDLNFIRYISTYNNYIDHETRSRLRRSNKNIKYLDPVEFYSKGKINRY